jgi:DNA invertase Pin-like site-specific DNA recombinase
MRAADKPRVTSPEAARAPQAQPLTPPASPEIRAAHREKLAAVYVRQSSPQQVLHHRESAARQYAFADQAVAYGWPRERVLAIDEDLGKSGRSAEGRAGFQRLVTEVTLGHVGMVLGLEMSRLARSSKDWHASFETCAAFGTLIADEGGVYDGHDTNDRLVLGLKGIPSEMELHVMRNRLERGRDHEAQRGELFYSVPMGYVQLPDGRVDLDPDEQARSVVQLIFAKFDEVGTVHGVFRWLIRHGIALPIRPRRGVSKGRLEWRRPSISTLTQMPHHPMYAGAYAHGRRLKARRRSAAAGQPRGGVRLPPEQWQVLTRDRLPAYITWDHCRKNLQRLKQNQARPDTRGTPRNGGALLAGLVICGHCNWRMSVNYSTKDHPFYACHRHPVHATQKVCFGLSAHAPDEPVGGQVLRALEPAALELSPKARDDLRRERERLGKHWKQRLQRARYDVELAERRYRVVDPSNRLVAATLERQREEALRHERELREEYGRCGRQTAPPVSAEGEARIVAPAADMPALGSAAQTTNADRQAIVRCLVGRGVVRVDRHSERAECTIHWVGGYESRHAFFRPVRTYAQLSAGDLLKERLAELRDAGEAAGQTAGILNAEGFKGINPGKPFNRDIVRKLLLKLGLRGERRDDALLRPGEWWVRDLAAKIGMAWQTLREWAVKGRVHSRRTGVEKLWIAWADKEELKRLRRLAAARHRGTLGYPPELTTPKRRPAASPWRAAKGRGEGGPLAQ